MTAPLIVSVVALVFSLASLIWQAWSWYRSGPVVTLKTSWAYGVGGLDGGTWVGVTAHNSGRVAAQVTSWGFETPHGSQLVIPVPLPISKPLPYTLEAHSDGSWYMGVAELEAACAAAGTRIENLRAHVTLGSGKKIRARSRGIGTRK